MRTLKRLLKKRLVVLDGAMGTNLMEQGLAPGESPSMLNVRDPESVYALQQAYVKAGSDVILTNTFSANPCTIDKLHLSEVLSAGAAIAKRAAKDRAAIWGDIGPLGELVEPYGDFPFDRAYGIFHTIARVLNNAGIKQFFIETFTSISEAKAAFMAVREFSKNIFVSFSLQDNCRTLMGELPETIAVTFDALGAQGIGVNCSHPKVIERALSRMARYTPLPLIAKPNAGRIVIQKNTVRHTLSDRQLAEYYDKFVRAGAQIIGGCCGSTPAFIQRIKRKHNKIKKRNMKKTFILAGPQRILALDRKSHFIVGERLNPSGRKKIQQYLREGNYPKYAEEARQQEDAGADILDVNAFIVDKEEETVLKQAVEEVLKKSQLPLFIDTQSVKAALKVLAFYPGIGVLNSVSARTKELRTWLPLVKRYGFKAVISLIGSHIPRTVKDRLRNVRHVLKIARQLGFHRDDLIFDPLVFSLATDREQIDHALKTVEILKKRGLKTVLGISNISFGLPERSHLNAVMATAAIQAGTTFLILNPLDERVRKSVISATALYGDSIQPYIAFMRASSQKQNGEKYTKKVVSPGLIEEIVTGNADICTRKTKQLLKNGVAARDVIDRYVTKAMQRVGEKYERGEAFIPDLLQAADAAKSVLNVVRPKLPKGKRKGRIMLATVKGDIHDIGKNIAGMVFESAGYEVIDLGKDVSIAAIVTAVKKHKPDLLGLSALLTTTMPEMERIITHLRASRLTVKVIIGGPNVSKRFADKIGAYGAATNVQEGLKLIDSIM